MAKRDPSAKTRYCSHGRVLRDKAGRLAAEGIKEMGDGAAEPWGMEGVGEGSSLGSVWSTCPMQWLADSQGQDSLVASKKTKACMG